MEYATAANWEMDLLEKLEGSSVTGMYGQIWNDPMGGGRMSIFLPRVNRDQAAAYIREARKKGWNSTILLMPPVLTIWSLPERVMLRSWNTWVGYHPLKRIWSL